MLLTSKLSLVDVSIITSAFVLYWVIVNVVHCVVVVGGGGLVFVGWWCLWGVVFVGGGVCVGVVFVGSGVCVGVMFVVSVCEDLK